MDETIDLEALRDSVRIALARECPAEFVRQHCGTDALFSASLWNVAAELGWLGVSIDEGHGGLGLGLDALAVLYEEIGRVVAPIPILSGMLAVEAVRHGASAAQRADWLPQIAAGTLKGAISYGAGVTAATHGSDVQLTGTAAEILDGGSADLIIVQVDLDGIVRRVAVMPRQDGIAVVTTVTADRTRSFASIVFDGIALPAERLLARFDEAVLMRHAALGIACDAFGGADAMLGITIDYLKTREQFGRVIGSFQALKHRIADHKAGLVVSQSALEDVAASAGRGDLALVDALAAKAHATQVAGAVTRDCVQLHGGIGFTAEYAAHLYLKRALLNAALFGTVAETLDAVALELAA